MGLIRKLSEDLIGKIAAGEVVERPAAAIKELVENSMDAGATQILTEIGDGGCNFFRVVDNGCGIDETDIRMAFERHATSKLKRAEDLYTIGTMGFRGEALASIAAVGRVTMTTRTAEHDTGVRVQNEGGQIVSVEEAACQKGTAILVRDLFFNTPVRRGFMKKPTVEAGVISDLMVHMILSRPDISFRYVSNGRVLYHSTGDGTLEAALHCIWGGTVLKTLRRVEGHQSGVMLSGYVGIGENARSARSGEYFFINDRMMRSTLLAQAVEDACRERVMIGKYPLCALHLKMPYEAVDVNVHPNKLEVRFRDEEAVLDAVRTLVWKALQDRDAFERPIELQLMPRQEDETTESLQTEGTDKNTTGISDAAATSCCKGNPTTPDGQETEKQEAQRLVLPPITVKVEIMDQVPPLPTESEMEKARAEALKSQQKAFPEETENTDVEQENTPAVVPALQKGDASEAGRTLQHGCMPDVRIRSVLQQNEAAQTTFESVISNSITNKKQRTGDFLHNGAIREEAAAIVQPACNKALIDHGVLINQGNSENDKLAAENGMAEKTTPFTTQNIPKSIKAPAEQVNTILPEIPKTMRILGAVFHTFILVEYEDQLLLVDQHAVHERLLFDKMKAAFEKNQAGQELLIPLVMPVTRREQALMEENRELLEGVGMQFEAFGDTDVAIRSVPMVLGQTKSLDFLRDVLDELAGGKTPGAEQKRAAILQMACKRAVKGGEELTEADLRWLINEMLTKQVTPTCPHGRPLVVSISHAELDRKFRRIQ